MLKVIFWYSKVELLILIGMFTVNNAYANDNVLAINFLLSVSGVLKSYELNSGLKEKSQLLTHRDWKQSSWPSYDSETRSIFFESQNKSTGWKSTIYRLSLSKTSNVPKEIVRGRYPSLSKDGKLLSYFKYPEELWILNIADNHVEKMVDDIDEAGPAVWISKHHLLYTNKLKEMILLDILNKEKSKTGFNKLIPVSLSPNGKNILCITYDGKKIISYYINTNRIKVLKSSRFLSIANTFIWNPDGKGFLYARQTWKNLLRFKEAKSLFYYYLDGSEQFLLDNIALFGGVLINDL